MADKKSKQKYTCSMHPDVKKDKPGKCPTCGMKLVPENAGSSGAGMKM